jgi:tetratricopeptide (TPR) repeat protein
MELIMQRFIARGVTVLALLLTGCASGPSAELEDGWEFMMAQNYPAARDQYKAILTEYPDNPYAHLNLGVAYQTLGEFDLARQHYEAAIANGGEAEISRVVLDGAVDAQVTTVADKGRENLQTLPN